jgi:putative ABC transport system permease protein
MSIHSLLKSLQRNKSGPLLVSAQVAITLAVLVNVLYLLQQQIAEVKRPTGLDLDNMFWISIEPTRSDYNYPSATRADLLYLNSLPQVMAASTTNNLPQGGGVTDLEFAANPEDLQKAGGGISGVIYFGTDRYLETLGLKLSAGRNFKPEEVRPPQNDADAAFSEWAPQVIITQALANKLFPNGNALGQPLFASLINKTSTIIGIVDYMEANPASERFRSYAEQIVFVPVTAPGPNATYIVRARPGQRAALMAQLRKDFADLQPDRFLSWMEDYNRTADNVREGARSSIVILSVVAACVLAVTLVGISGLAAFNVTKRTRQLGIRRAIGASRSLILSMVLMENWIITAFGTLLGCVLALGAAIGLQKFYDQQRFPLYYLLVASVSIWIVSLLAVWVPARRAASIAPALATRSV